MELLPSSIDSLTSITLIGTTFISGFITAAMGIGGGIMLLAVMASLMPAAVVIAVHGVTQLGANISRAAFQWSHIDWRTFVYFGGGAIIGIVIGASIVITLPDHLLRAGMALFILYMVWGPRMAFLGTGDLVAMAMGLVSSILTMFFGATGPFISALLQQRSYTPRRLVGTHAVCMSAQHALKIVAFGVLGFAFSEWIGLMVLMLVAGFFGTWLGSLVLNRLPALIFARALKIVLTLLACNLLATASGLYSIV